MALLTHETFAISRLSADLAEAFGNSPGEEGCRLLSIAAEHGRSRVALRDWVYCLARTPGTYIHKRFIDALRKTADSFIAGVESRFDEELMTDLPPASLLAGTVSADVLAMLDQAEQLADSLEKPVIDDAVLTLSILGNADDDLLEMLQLWASPADVEQLTATLQRDIQPRPEKTAAVFNPDGTINDDAFSPSGQRLIKRITDDAAGLNMQKLTTRNVLYTLLGNESGPLSSALAVHGFDTRQELHGILVRELKRAGRAKRSQFQLTEQACYAPVVQMLNVAMAQAHERHEERISENDIHCALALADFREIRRLAPPDHHVNEQAFVSYVRSAAQSQDADNLQDLDEAPKSAKEIEAGIRSRLFGQDSAIGQVMPWIKRLQFGIPRDGRPACVLLFIGPTGTGKTQLARELAGHVFGDADRLLFLEMGQFKTPHSVTGMIGASPGYVGYGEGKLTNGLRDESECVVLFDEIEKAHTQVFDVILRFADEGLISDPAGPVRDGRRCIIVLTTNAGQTWLRSHLDDNPTAIDDPETLSRRMFDAAMDELAQSGFRPEFLARVDERLMFMPLTGDVCEKIVRGILKQELEKFETLKQVTVNVDDDAIAHLSRMSEKRVFLYGARAVPRIVNEFLVTPLIDLLVDSQIDSRSETHVRVVLNDSNDQLAMDIIS